LFVAALAAARRGAGLTVASGQGARPGEGTGS